MNDKECVKKELIKNEKKWIIEQMKISLASNVYVFGSEDRGKLIREEITEECWGWEYDDLSKKEMSLMKKLWEKIR